jgi:peptidoglycan/LPS O-acetylase OafA/YrhL
LVYRADIDGLRAIAILVVVLFHAGVRGFDGGFVGVDVFFVISGWLITQQLLHRTLSARGVGLIEFWGRRIRRLVPAAFCMVVGVTLLSLLLLSPLDWRLIAQRGVATALYGSNLLFAARAGDYFSGPLKDSPYLHTWSLSVEEQFYLVWPFIFAGGLLLFSRKDPARFKRALAVAMAVIFVVSMIVNIRLTNAESPWAFFGLPARAWEFAAAGLAATLLTGRDVVPRTWVRPLTVLGVAMIAIAVFTFTESTPFPGYAALLPVLGTLIVVIAGHTSGSSNTAVRPLQWKPVVALGLLSYSWYLWHWPLMILAVGATYRDTTTLRLAAAVAALFVAMLSFRFVENPIRYSERLRHSPGRTYAMGAALVAGAVLISGALWAYQRREIQQEPYREYEAARQSYQQKNCTVASSPNGMSYCESGDLESATTVMLVGDSHAEQWMAAFGDVASDLGIHVVLRSSGNCPATPPSESGDGLQLARSCADHQQATQDLIDELQPAALVLADADGTKARVFTDGVATWRDALEEQVRELQQQGTSVGIVVDAPLSDDPLLCLARGRSESHCTLDRDDALQLVDRYRPARNSVVHSTGIPVLDVNRAICTKQACRIRIDDVWVFGAFEHITQDFTFSQRDAVAEFLSALTAQSGTP